MTQMNNPNEVTLIRIQYYKTYLNAGKVDIFLCEHYIGTIDALFDDFKHQRMTLPVLIELTHDPYRYMDKQKNNHINSNSTMKTSLDVEVKRCMEPILVLRHHCKTSYQQDIDLMKTAANINSKNNKHRSSDIKSKKKKVELSITDDDVYTGSNVHSNEGNLKNIPTLSEYYNARGTQKFKVNTIRMCSANVS